MNKKAWDNYHLLHWLAEDERSVTMAVASTVKAFTDRIHDPGDPRCPEAIAASRRSMKEIEDRLERMERELRAKIASGARVDLNHPGFLTLLRQVLSLLHRIDGLLETRTKLANESAKCTKQKKELTHLRGSHAEMKER